MCVKKWKPSGMTFVLGAIMKTTMMCVIPTFPVNRYPNFSRTRSSRSVTFLIVRGVRRSMIQLNGRNDAMLTKFVELITASAKKNPSNKLTFGKSISKIIY